MHTGMEQLARIKFSIPLQELGLIKRAKNKCSERHVRWSREVDAGQQSSEVNLKEVGQMSPAAYISNSQNSRPNEIGSHSENTNRCLFLIHRNIVGNAHSVIPQSICGVIDSL